MTLRPYGVVTGGELQLGQELVIESGVIREIRPHTGIPEDFVVSPAFVNAHSHLEYRGLLGKLDGPDYFSWIRQITQAKKKQTAEEVRNDCLLAARENRKTGVAYIAEHSDRPYAAEALNSANLPGIVFQELITFFEHEAPEQKRENVESARVRQQEAFGRGPVYSALHSAFTVDRATLAAFGSSGEPTSIHVAESAYEKQFFRKGEGPIASFYDQNSVPFDVYDGSVVEYLDSLGLARPKVQFVHCCDLSASDLALLAASGVSVAHCPRSNTRLKCPTAPIREMLDLGIRVGLGLDSPASSGPIDMFAEMREAVRVSCERGKPVPPEEAWRMATSLGRESLAFGSNSPAWDIYEGSSTPLIALRVDGAFTTEDLLDRACPEVVEWI